MSHHDTRDPRPGEFPTPPREAAPTATLQNLALYLGWGSMSDDAIFSFACGRERLLRLAQDELETSKSPAPTAEAALRERITALKSGSLPDPARAAFVAQVREWLKVGPNLNVLALLRDRILLSPVTDVFRDKRGWPATLEAIAEALRAEGGPT
jgi:hypothetical protein